jgi:hypothetical protein
MNKNQGYMACSFSFFIHGYKIIPCIKKRIPKTIEASCQLNNINEAASSG